MEKETVVLKNTSPKAEGENKKPEDINAVVDLTSPPTKKLKQARLPFKVLTAKLVGTPVSTNNNQKKRKLSDGQWSPQQCAKTPKNSEHGGVKSENDDCIRQKVKNGSESKLIETERRDDPADGKTSEVSLPASQETRHDGTGQVVVDSSDGSNSDCKKIQSDEVMDEIFRKETGKNCLSEESVLASQDSIKQEESSIVDVHGNEKLTSDDIPSDGGSEDKTESLSKHDKSESGAELSQDDKGCPVAVSKEAETSSRDHPVRDANSGHLSGEDVINTDVSDSEDNLTSPGSDGSSSSLCTSTEQACGTPSQEDVPGGDNTSSTDMKPSFESTPKSSHVNSVRKGHRTSSIKKSAEKQKDKELAMLEKQRRREAREKERRQRLEAKAKKEQERLEAKRKKEEEKLRLQKEREEKSLQKEEERKKKLLEKELEKRRRQEILDAKIEEKKKKEEERLKAEEELKLKKEKEKALFTKFFKKSDKQLQTTKQTEEVKTGPFIAFEVKDNMRLAPQFRIDESARQEKMAHLDKVMSTQEASTLYLDEMKQKSYKPGRATKTWPVSNDVELIPDIQTYYLRVKLLQFHENYRPAYYGTWRKQSHLIKPRNPLQKDQELFDYEVDSDEEWEEEEPGESLSHSEGEGSDEEKDNGGDEDDDDDGFFVPHGYLSEGEGCEDEDEDVSPDQIKARQLAKAKAWEAEVKKRKLEVLKPVCIGCLWSDVRDSLKADPDWLKLQQYEVVPLVATPISVRLTTVSESVMSSDTNKEVKKHSRLMPVPDEAIPDLIRFVHGNIYGIQTLVKEFQEYWLRKSLKSDEAEQSKRSSDKESVSSHGNSTSVSSQPEVESRFCTESRKEKNSSCELSSDGRDGDRQVMSKRQLSVMIRALAVYQKRPEVYNKTCWHVHKEALLRYHLTDLPMPTAWQWVTHIKPRRRMKSDKSSGIKNDEEERKAKASATPSHDIKQFAVLGYTPPIQPQSSKMESRDRQAVDSERTPNLKHGTPMRGKSKHRKETIITPSVLFSPSTEEKRNGKGSKTAQHSRQEMKVREGNQKTLLSMYPLPKTENSFIHSDTSSATICKPGDSAELPMEID